MNRHRWMLLGILAAAMLFTMACGMINTLMSGRSSGTVANLWSDVPPIEGASKADLEFPLAARLMVQLFAQGRMNFISYTSSKTPQEIQSFYTKERMAQSGWNSEDAPGCVADTGSDQSLAGVCFFGRQDGATQEGLAIVMAIDEETQQTQIFYARIDVTEATPSE
jgi:hypothetical protein